MNSERNARALTVAAAAAGTADTAAFLGRRRHLFTRAPRRAAGTVLGLALWAGLGLSAAAERRPGRRTLALAATVAAANAVLLAAHLRAGVVRPRAFLGAGLAALALGGAVAGVRRPG
ncbi:MAG TPA: hypothetical protein VFD49_22370 [Candidatus Dormibacteraeota bacterium]|nr:hypothetical protein [Candidatus Dormibacteraeota bacterium]